MSARNWRRRGSPGAPIRVLPVVGPVTPTVHVTQDGRPVLTGHVVVVVHTATTLGDEREGVGTRRVTPTVVHGAVSTHGWATGTGRVVGRGVSGRSWDRTRGPQTTSLSCVRDRDRGGREWGRVTGSGATRGGPECEKRERSQVTSGTGPTHGKERRRTTPGPTNRHPPPVALVSPDRGRVVEGLVLEGVPSTDGPGSLGLTRPLPLVPPTVPSATPLPLYVPQVRPTPSRATPTPTLGTAMETVDDVSRARPVHAVVVGEAPTRVGVVGEGARPFKTSVSF